MGRAEDIFERIIKENESAIDDFIQTRQFEELFLDFKRSVTMVRDEIYIKMTEKIWRRQSPGLEIPKEWVSVWGIDCSEGSARS